MIDFRSSDGDPTGVSSIPPELHIRLPGSELATLPRVRGAGTRFAALVPGATCSSVFCAVIDRRGGTLRYSSAGHLPAILLDAHGGHRLLDDALAVPLAVLPGRTRPEASAPLDHDSTLLLYTDGLVERRGEDIDHGIERAVRAVSRIRTLPPDAVVAHLGSALLTGGHDDAAYLVHRHHPFVPAFLACG